MPFGACFCQTCPGLTGRGMCRLIDTFRIEPGTNRWASECHRGFIQRSILILTLTEFLNIISFHIIFCVQYMCVHESVNPRQCKALWIKAINPIHLPIDQLELNNLSKYYRNVCNVQSVDNFWTRVKCVNVNCKTPLKMNYFSV